MKYLLSIGTLVSLQAVAQTSQSLPSDRDLVAFSWEITSPTSNKYINETSMAGWRFEYRKGIKHNLSVGIALSWSAVDEFVPTKTYTSLNKTTAITTDMIRQVYTLPLTLTGHYYLSSKGKLLQPYLGLGMGAQYSEQKAFANIYEFNETSWGFVARPEIGTLLRFSAYSPIKGLLAFGYNFSTNKNEAFDIDSWSQLTFNVGISVGTSQ